MQSWHTTYLGLKELPRELSTFELQTFFTFSPSERKVIDARYGATHMSVHLQCVTFELSIGTNTFKLSPNQRLKVRSPVRYANPDAPNE